MQKYGFLFGGLFALLALLMVTGFIPFSILSVTTLFVLLGIGVFLTWFSG